MVSPNPAKLTLAPSPSPPGWLTGVPSCPLHVCLNIGPLPSHACIAFLGVPVGALPFYLHHQMFQAPTWRHTGRFPCSLKQCLPSSTPCTQWRCQSHFYVCNLNMATLAVPALCLDQNPTLMWRWTVLYTKKWLQAHMDPRWSEMSCFRGTSGKPLEGFSMSHRPTLPAPNQVLANHHCRPQPNSSQCEIHTGLRTSKWCVFCSQHPPVWTRPRGFNWVFSSCSSHCDERENEARYNTAWKR